MNLTRNDGKNAGSLGKLWIKLKAEITDTNTPVDTYTDGLTIADDITLSGVWTPIEIVVGESSWQEVFNESEETYSFSIQTNIHRDRQAVTESLMRFAGREIMVLAQDRNDLLNRLIGEAGLYEYHARLSFSNVKEKTPGRNSYDITITGTMHHPACYYSAAIPE
jgi:hypothetical protein